MIIGLIEEGEGPPVAVGDVVYAYYEGRLDSTGEVFDSNIGGQPFSFTIGNGEVIAAWDQGLVGIPVLSQVRIITPPQFAYGDRDIGNGLIPPNSTLDFTVLVASVNEPPTFQLVRAPEEEEGAEEAVEQVADELDTAESAPQTQPAAQPAAQPVAQPVTESVAETIVEPVAQPATQPVHPEDHADTVVESGSALDALFNQQVDAMLALSQEILADVRDTFEQTQNARDQLLQIVVQTLMSQSKDFGEQSYQYFYSNFEELVAEGKEFEEESDATKLNEIITPMESVRATVLAKLSEVLVRDP